MIYAQIVTRVKKEFPGIELSEKSRLEEICGKKVHIFEIRYNGQKFLNQVALDGSNFDEFMTGLKHKFSFNFVHI